jgi:hypothetical protein
MSRCVSQEILKGNTDKMEFERLDRVVTDVPAMNSVLNADRSAHTSY